MSSGIHNGFASDKDSIFVPLIVPASLKKSMKPKPLAADLIQQLNSGDRRDSRKLSIRGENVVGMASSKFRCGQIYRVTFRIP
jgi:hypothetical protein